MQGCVIHHLKSRVRSKIQIKGKKEVNKPLVALMIEKNMAGFDKYYDILRKYLLQRIQGRVIHQMKAQEE